MITGFIEIINFLGIKSKRFSKQIKLIISDTVV